MVWISPQEAEPWKVYWMSRQLGLTLASPEQVLLDTRSVVFLSHLLCAVMILSSSNPTLGPPAPCAYSSLFPSDVRKVFLEQGRLPPGLAVIYGAPPRRAQPGR